MSELPKAGETWRHWKGALYTVVCIACHTGDRQPLVIYRADGKEDGVVWARPLAEWFTETKVDRDDGGHLVPRFVRVSE